MCTPAAARPFGAVDCNTCHATQELNALFSLGQVLAHTEDAQQTLRCLLQELQDRGGLKHGLVALLEPVGGEMVLRAVHADPDRERRLDKIRYRPGEGVVGRVLQSGETVVIPKVVDDPRFLDRLRLYDEELPFIAVPVRMGGKTLGVLAAQPDVADPPLLAERAKFMEMMATLLGQVVRMSSALAEERRTLVRERDQLRKEVCGQYGFENMIGRSPAMRRVFEQIRAVAKWTTTVLICGESGTGKELAATAIHYHSPRADKPFVRLNCAALSEPLLESELFGHEKGAFTGAADARVGRFEQADGGTLFLDEIGEISPSFQAKLLRVLQEGEFERVGSSKTRKIDVRIITATNRNLEEEVAAGDFREDLFYRLNVMPIHIPPLRSRPEEIPDLANFLARRIARRQGRELRVTDCAVRLLVQYEWPGNVREMENYLERAAVMTEDGTIDRNVLNLTGLAEQILHRGGNPGESTPPFTDPDLDERERVLAALEHAGWVQAKAARLLGMTPRQVAYRIQQFNIRMRKI
jgi:Nif-specific regulatory protein